MADSFAPITEVEHKFERSIHVASFAPEKKMHGLFLTLYKRRIPQPDYPTVSAANPKYPERSRR